MGNCKDCRFWDCGVCDRAEWGEDDETPRDDGMLLYATAADDWGLRCKLKTGSLFGCVQFQAAK